MMLEIKGKCKEAARRPEGEHGLRILGRRAALLRARFPIAWHPAGIMAQARPGLRYMLQVQPEATGGVLPVKKLDFVGGAAAHRLRFTVEFSYASDDLDLADDSRQVACPTSMGASQMAGDGSHGLRR